MPLVGSDIQFEALRRINGSADSWWVRADISYELARSLMADARLSFKVSNPGWYWAFPPSVALAFWGLFFFFYFPRTICQK
jgi:hypothetical protein